MTKNQKLSMLFVASQLIESLYWECHSYLNDLSKVKFQAALTRIKHLNKDFESVVPHRVDDLENDAAYMYSLLDEAIKATEGGRENELMELIKEFNNDNCNESVVKQENRL